MAKNRRINILLKLTDKFTKPMKEAGKISNDQVKALKACSNSVMDFSNKVRSGMGQSVKHIATLGGAISAISFAGLTAGFLSMADATEEYRKAMGKLTTAFQSVGFQTETAQKSYQEFYKILGDTDTATEASQLLAQLARNEQDVTKWTKIAAGVSGTFGDSLPIEGFIEATNETAKVAKVTGVLADALNWVGISEDDMNLKLEALGTEEERNALLMETLAGAYNSAADAFYKNNAVLVATRANQAAMQKVTGTLGEASAIAKNKLFEMFGVASDGSVRAGSAMEFITAQVNAFKDKIQSVDVSAWSEKISAFVQKIPPMLEQVKGGLSTVWQFAKPILTFALEHARTLIPVIAGVGLAISSLSIISDIATKVSGFVKVVKTAKTAFSALNLVMRANPIGIVITVIGALIAVGVLLYKNWDTVKEKFISVFNAIKEKATAFVNAIKKKLQPFIDLITSIKEGLAAIGFGSNNPGTATVYTQQKALGTPYFKGGLTSINERGGEIVSLPSGTKIIPHDVSQKAAGGTTVNVTMNIAGNVLGNRAYMEEVGAYIAKKVLLAQGVV